MNVVNCDKCKKDFMIEVKEKEIKERIYKVLFTCPHCNKDYISYYTSILVRLKQKKINDLIKEYEENRGKDSAKAEKLFKKYQKMKREILKDMNNLEKRATEN